MSLDELAALLQRQMTARGLTASSLHAYLCAARLSQLPSRQTVYNAVAAKPVYSDTLLVLLDALDLEIVKKATTPKNTKKVKKGGKK